MPIRSRFGSQNLILLVSDPLWRTDRQAYLETLYADNSYKQTVTDKTGYDQAGFQFTANLNLAEEWLLEGLGRHLVTKSPDLVTVWEGFVNKISLRVGPVSLSVGPLLDVANRVSAVYSTMDTSVDPPVAGGRATTSVANDTDSQNLWGALAKNVSQGGSTQTMAEQARDTFLAAKKDPPTSSDDNFGGAGNPSLQIDLLGYYYFFGAYLFSASGTGEQDASEKITDVIQADPGGIFSTDLTGIEANTFPVNVAEDGNSTARTVIEDVVSLGDASDNAFNFGVYADRKVIYEQAPAETSIEYLYRATERTRQVENLQGDLIKPWYVLPGRWRRTPDIFIGRSGPLSVGKDLRNSFLTKVEFRAPDDVRLVGDELEELPQLMKKLTGGGV